MIMKGNYGEKKSNKDHCSKFSGQENGLWNKNAWSHGLRITSPSL